MESCRFTDLHSIIYICLYLLSNLDWVDNANSSCKLLLVFLCSSFPRPLKERSALVLTSIFPVRVAQHVFDGTLIYSLAKGVYFPLPISIGPLAKFVGAQRHNYIEAVTVLDEEKVVNEQPEPIFKPYICHKHCNL